MDALDEFKVELLDNGCHIRSDLEQSGTTLTSYDPIQIATIRLLAAALINRTRQRDEAIAANDRLIRWMYVRFAKGDHACMTGDCGHDNPHDCLQAIKEAYQEDSGE